MKKSIYEISQEALEISEALENGELTDELEQRLVINQHELQTKSINYGFVIKDSEANVKAIEEEIKRLQALKKVEENKQERLKEALKSALNIYGFEKVESPVMKIGFRKSESIEVVSMEQLPDKFKRHKTTIDADKTAIKEAIKLGETVEGAVLKVNQNIQIR